MARMSIEANVVGTAALQKLLKELPDAYGRQVQNKGLRAAGGVLRAEVRAKHPWRRVRKAARVATVRSGRGRSKVVFGFAPPVSRIVHFGEFGFTHRSGRPVAAIPVIRTAIDTVTGNMFKAARDTMAAEADKIARRLAGRYSQLSSRDRRALGRK